MCIFTLMKRSQIEIDATSLVNRFQRINRINVINSYPFTIHGSAFILVKNNYYVILMKWWQREIKRLSLISRFLRTINFYPFTRHDSALNHNISQSNMMSLLLKTEINISTSLVSSIQRNKKIEDYTLRHYILHRLIADLHFETKIF